jgi:hypothetical protein
MRRSLPILLPLTFVTVAACEAPGMLTIGIQSEGLDTYLGSYHVVTTVDGVTQTDKVFRSSQVALFPQEIKIDPGGRFTPQVGVRVEGFAGDDPATSLGPVIVRTAHTTMLPAPANKLLRIQLDSRCVTVPPSGGVPGPTCVVTGQTCIAGACVDDTEFGNELEDYSPTWPAGVSDACHSANPGPPVVVVGTGQTDYLPLTDGETLKAETGPQGGHHIWIAVRMHDLKQSGSTTTVTATQPGTGATIPPFSVVFTYLPDEGGFCKLYGLRFQLDNQGVDYTQFLGKPLDVQVTVHDLLGEEGTAVAHVNIDPTVLGL